MKGSNVLMLAACVVFACGVASGGDDGLKAAVNAAVAKHSAAVVPIKVVVSVKAVIQGREMPAQERESETLGTVLDETGLIVASYFAVDSAGAAAPQRPNDKIDSEVKSARLVRKDGTELPLKVVLRDTDLDLIFFRPEKKTELPNIGLKNKGGELELADNVIVLGRLGTIGDRQPSVLVSRIEAVIDKPRRLYVTSTMDCMTTLGCPAFNESGELAGLMVIRLSLKADGGALGGLRSQVLPAILPAADVLNDMAQIEKPKE